MARWLWRAKTTVRMRGGAAELGHRARGKPHALLLILKRAGMRHPITGASACKVPCMHACAPGSANYTIITAACHQVGQQAGPGAVARASALVACRGAWGAVNTPLRGAEGCALGQAVNLKRVCTHGWFQ